MGIVEKIESLRALEEQYNARRAAVTEAIVETIRSIGQNPSVRQISKNCFTTVSYTHLTLPTILLV